MRRHLSLGTGNRLMKARKGTETIHHDLEKHRPEIDVTHDLNKLPWPWPDDNFDFIEAWSVFEHLKLDMLEIVNECWRLLRPGGVLRIKVPRWDAKESYEDPTHRWRFALGSWDCFDPDTKRGRAYVHYTPYKWRLAYQPHYTKPGGPSIVAELITRKDEPDGS